MSFISATKSDRYTLVSSFYGPGAVEGWYLTALACLISSSLHPRKRSQDSITTDMIAVLTFPTVAAADLTTQVQSYSTKNSTLAQNAASIEAALIVTETFLAIDVILFLLAIGFKCVRRGSLLAAIGLFCFSAECYLYFSTSVSQAIEHNLDRPFLINFGSVLISIMAVLLICIVLALSLVTLFFAMLPQRSHAQTLNRDVEAMRKEMKRDFKDSRNAQALSLISMLFLPGSFVASLLPLYSGVFKGLPVHFLPWLRAAASHIAHDLIPTSNTSVKELDQAVAILAGASVLGFSLYSTVDTYYQAWLLRTSARPQQRAIELRTQNRRQGSSH